MEPNRKFKKMLKCVRMFANCKHSGSFFLRRRIMTSDSLRSFNTTPSVKHCLKKKSSKAEYWGTLSQKIHSSRPACVKKDPD